jgi:hypothetical protein
MSITISELKAKILATKVTGDLRNTIIKYNFTYDELTKLYLELPDLKIRRWHRSRKIQARSVFDERQSDLF